MHVPTLMLYVLCHVPAAAAQPALPDMERLVWSAITLSTLPPNQRVNWEEDVREGLKLARWLNRARDRMALRGETPGECLNFMSVLQQLDFVLNNLNPNPSTEEVVARGHAYREWFCVIYRGQELMRGAGKDMRNTDFHLDRATRSFEEKYGPYFSRDFRSCDPWNIPPLPTPPVALPPPSVFTPNVMPTPTPTPPAADPR